MSAKSRPQIVISTNLFVWKMSRGRLNATYIQIQQVLYKLCMRSMILISFLCVYVFIWFYMGLYRLLYMVFERFEKTVLSYLIVFEILFFLLDRIFFLS